MTDTAETLQNGNITILIVEDDAGTMMLIKHFLGSAGYNIRTAIDGSQARAVLDEATPDLILLDLLLPDTTGLELLKEVKARGTMNETPVLILSAVEDVGAKVDGLDFGAEDYMVKPIDKHELLARVRVAVRKYEAKRKLQDDLSVANTQSVTDNLTGLYNRHYLNGFIEKEISSSIRYGRGFSVMILDVDFFKAINDTFGHVCGDGVLRALAGILKEQTRASDTVARYGGEEFVIVLPHTDIESGIGTAEKLRQSVEAFMFPDVDGRSVTVSIGLTQFNPEKDSEMNAIIKRADDALYAAKQTGRNKVIAG